MKNKEAKIWNKNTKTYFQDILSPFSKGTINPIFWYMKNKIKKSKNKSVIDIGTGIGNFIPKLSENFKSVVGIDISPNIIEVAKKNGCKI